MKLKPVQLFLIFGLCLSKAWALPAGFVYLQAIDPSIQQDLRYASPHNFVGRPINGYLNQQCILTVPAAVALEKLQTALKPLGFSIKVYDCYRPARASTDFLHWSLDASAQEMKAEFYPRTNKAYVFRLGYVAAQSGHNRGSTVDLTLVPYPTPPQTSFNPKQKLEPCMASVGRRFRDNSIDMGTGYDCLDPSAYFNYPGINKHALKHRFLLRKMMIKYGFEPYNKEWWHFTLSNEPYPKTYFDFPVQ